MSINNQNTYLNIEDAHLRLRTGNVYAQGITIGGITVDPSHGLQRVSDTGNVTTTTLQFDNATTAFTTTANVTVGRDLTVTGNALVSSNLTVTGNAVISDDLTVTGNAVTENLLVSNNLTVTGNTFYTNPAAVLVDSNVVTEYTGPHDRPLRKYPEVALTSASQGGYVASTNNKTPGTSGVPYRDAFMAYDGGFTTMNVMWQTLINSYDSNGDDVSGDTFTAGSISYVGHWNKLQLPNPIKVDKIEIIALQSTAVPANDQRPDQGAFLGSIDGTNWELIYSFSSGTLGWSEAGDASAIRKITTITDITNTNKYNYLVLVVEKIPSTSTAAQLGVAELRYYGHEEGSGSIDTTLKSVYNVPATTGTQLEVYYDGQDYSADTDFDQANEVLDKSGNNLHGSQTGGVGFDPTYKAFTFDGSGDSISRVITNSQGAYVHSWSTWVKLDTLSGQILWHLGLDGTGGTGGSDTSSIYIESDGSLNWFWWSNDVKFSNQKLITGTWYHLAGSYNGGAPISSRKLWINGIEQVISSTSGSQLNTALGLEANTTLRLGTRYNGGGFLDGSIANFRLYSKALNAEQIQELYDYQKDYFLGSKSQVTLYKGHLGVGVTEPSGQLELAGDERIQEYPPGPMTGYETLIPGHGVFCASASSYYNYITHLPWQAFTPASTTITDGWNSGDNSTGTNLGYYTETSSGEATSAAALFEGTRGEWVQLKCPYPIIVKKFAITGRSNGVYGGSPEDQPKSGILYGSNDGNNWDILANFSGLTYGGASGGAGTTGGTELVEVNARKGYTRLVLQATARVSNYGTDDWINIGQLQFFGTPGPTTLDKGSLSLTRSLDVPRISRYNVDTETPRYEKLLVDFDTTVNSSPTDISGKGNHGTFNGGATYSAADKAFDIPDAGNISATLTSIPSADFVHSVSVWVKFEGDTLTTSYPYVYFMGTNLSYSGFGLFFAGAARPNQLHVSCWQLDYPINFTFSNDTWHHVTYTYSGGGWSRNSSLKAYVDGIEYGFGTNWSTGTEGTTPTIATSNVPLRLGAVSTGGVFDGKISNFKLYSVALEPSEVQKLYRLGRTGRSMVISDTAVGIGKVPEANLDVRGNLNVSSFIKYDSAWFYAYDGNSNGSGSFNNYSGFVPWNVLQTGSTHFTTASASTSGGYYTAPVDGIYHFDTSVLNYPDARTGITGIYFSVNDSTGGETGINSYGYNRKTDMPGQEHMNASATFRLNEGDTVKVYVTNIDCYTETGHAFFSGYLITRI